MARHYGWNDGSTALVVCLRGRAPAPSLNADFIPIRFGYKPPVPNFNMKNRLRLLAALLNIERPSEGNATPSVVWLFYRED